jgi:hypothetical protein
VKRCAALQAAVLLAIALVFSGQRSGAQTLPQTRAERSGYTETSSYADVRAFLDSLRTGGAPYEFGILGRSAGGREIPYVIASRPLVRTPEEARTVRGTRPVIFVQGNIHGGEVEGKEALLMLLRNLALERRPNVLDSLILIAVPVYNVDGNEELGPQERNRPDQRGPAIVGRRPNADGLDLNRDYIKAAAPETRAALAMFNAWDPDVFVDLHTTNGSLHGYALTYSPPLNPASPLGQRTREWLAELQERMRTRHSIEAFDYGNFGTDDTPWQERLIHAAATNAWTTFDHRPRFSTNYYGLRGGLAILSEAFSHDPFERRVASTYAFVREILSLAVDPRAAHWRLRYRGSVPASSVPVAARITRNPPIKNVRIEQVELTGDTLRTEPGLRPGVLRTGRFQSVRMPVYDRFDPTVQVQLPAVYVIPARLTGVLEMLAIHGIEAAPAPEVSFVRIDEFRVESLLQEERTVEQRREPRVRGEWVQSALPVAAGDYVVSVTGPRAALIAYLLDPESDDGLLTWGFLDGEVSPGAAFPVRRGVPAARPRR